MSQNARRNLRKAEAEQESGRLPGGAKAIERMRQEIAMNKELADIQYQAEFGRASTGKQALMLSQRRADSEKQAAEYASSAASREGIDQARKNLASAEERNAKEVE
jgi:hypothetical protein